MTGTGLSITIDGNFSDWNNIALEKVTKMNYSLAYNNSHFFVYAKWIDSSFDNLPCRIVKTAYDYTWEIEQEFNDVINFYIENDSFTDFWIWTASTNMTNGVNTFERLHRRYTGELTFADEGVKPHLYNWNYTFPIYDNNKNPLSEFNPPQGTSYWMWLGQTPSDSQTDVLLKSEWENGYYQIEMARLLNTGQPDDLIINPTADIDYRFSCSVGDKDVSMDEFSISYSYLTNRVNGYLGFVNEEATLIFNPILQPIANSIYYRHCI